ncbi:MULTISPECIES: NAD(P)/FAD-dependent oxidoreductase [unclassified Pseudoalteromonas]|uniref:NAD(P)/FAD-dependent oxidoreductase n=1 Tax=unclassified Pseudoalteromonas TaxID=194690 RepID=UPI002097414C|nr:NAD(P)/FAD-dependent oxidoreductase [Pseudoalteromonas sp. XMcav2-N]MCO7190728.1 NAD(P)/FAD-dependent oxidoreductase [Pseudoalteromonas sp. XMcav2-N]
MDHIDTVIIGAGVVGLAIAARLSQTRSVLVIDQMGQFGEHTSSRNSEVIHAGLYYAEHSLKARLCVRGKALLYAHCERFHVPVKRLGKILFARTTHELDKLAAIEAQAKRNGVHDLTPLSQTQIANMAPGLHTSAALFSPSTGIVDSHQLMLSLVHQLEHAGGNLVCHTRFESAEKTASGFALTLNCDGAPFELSCNTLINAGGLFAQDNAQRIAGLGKDQIPQSHLCRGQYFCYQGPHPFNHLIYPMPEQHGLGIHATLDMAGQLRFGPDTQFIDKLDYQVDAQAKARFVQAIQSYWPALDPERLHPDYAGIRPKLSREKGQDFMIEGHQHHQVEGLINLFGIESPGLTASLAIAEYVEVQL